jgi:chloramphenicol O-acetyltransferase type A
MNYQKVNIDKWYRRDAHLFFKDYDDPFFNLTAHLNISARLDYCKSINDSFFLHSIHGALKIVNSIDEFRMRMYKDEVILFDKINGGSTVLNDDKSFSFCYFDFDEDVNLFVEHGKESIEKTKTNKGIDPKTNQLDMIHFSSIPWVQFTSFKHARKYSEEDTIPKIVFGKYFNNNGEWYIPVSVEVHHSMMDGYHMGQFFQGFEEEMSQNPA